VRLKLMLNILSNMADVGSHNGEENWFYSDTVQDHFFNPRNLAAEDPTSFDAMGEVGSPACGDKMKVWIKVDSETDTITDFKWRTFGCASAIASTSVASEMIIGKTLEEAQKVTPREIVEALGGLPPRKIHCSVLADQALRAAIKNYQK